MNSLCNLQKFNLTFYYHQKYCSTTYSFINRFNSFNYSCFINDIDTNDNSLCTVFLHSSMRKIHYVYIKKNNIVCTRTSNTLVCLINSSCAS